MLFLILVSLLIAAGFLLAYLRAARDGQFDDDYTPSIRMLFEGTTPESAPIGEEKKPEPERTGEVKQQQD
ncbi:MAG: cbb3-type cytochrome oxidase assembly protein [Saprospiraceae bacterium]